MKEYILHKSNLLIALNTAIDTQREYERTKLNYNRDSALVAGWEDLKKELLENDDLIIKMK